MASEEHRYPLIPVTFSSEWDFNDYATTFGVEMSLIYNVLIRSLNSIWYHAPLVRKGDEVAFEGYSLAWASMLHHHHHGQETIVFPFLQSKLDMSLNVDQHASFREQLCTFEEYLTTIFTRKESYDGHRVRELVETFGDILVQHRNDEVRVSQVKISAVAVSDLLEKIPTLSPECPSQFDKKDLDTMIDAHSAHIKELPLTTSFAIILTHHDFKSHPYPPQFYGLF